MALRFLLPIQTGAERLAILCGVPIIPVRILGMWEWIFSSSPAGKKRLIPGVTIKIGEQFHWRKIRSNETGLSFLNLITCRSNSFNPRPSFGVGAMFVKQAYMVNPPFQFSHNRSRRTPSLYVYFDILGKEGDFHMATFREGEDLHRFYDRSILQVSQFFGSSHSLFLGDGQVL